MPKREQYLEKIKARFEQWDAKIEYEKQLEELWDQRDKAEAHLKEMQRTSKDAWQDLRAGFTEAWDAISKSFEKAASRGQ